MALSKMISATTAAVMLAATFASLPPMQAFATQYSGTSYENLADGDIVEIASFDELCYFSEYVNNGGNTKGVTWQLTDDISSGYSYTFNEETEDVLVVGYDYNEEFYLGTGISNTVMGEIESLNAYASPNYPTAFTMIGTDTIQFNGTFDGNGHEISGLYGCSAMFGTLKDAQVSNLTISDSYFYNESGDAASVALKLKGGEISYITVQDTFIGSNDNGNVGGIIACAESLSEDNDSTSFVIASQFVGNSVIVNSSNSKHFTGGIIGNTVYNGGSQGNTVENCNVTAPMYAKSTKANGFVGQLSVFFYVNNSLHFGNISNGDIPTLSGGEYSNAYTNDTRKMTSTYAEYIPTYIEDSQIISGEVTYILENLRKSAETPINVYWTQNLENGGTPILSVSQDFLVRCNGTGYENGSTDKHLTSGEYTANANGTHTYKCSNCNCDVTDECTFVNGACAYCNYVEIPEIVTKFGQKYYSVGNYSQLCWFAQQVVSGTAKTQNVIITADIIADENSEWIPIGTASCPYTGTFNGQNHYISGINTDDAETNYVGLFGYTNNATIYNFGVVDSNFNGTNYVAAFIGTAVNTQVSDCYAYNNTVECENTNVSGFIAYATSGYIKYSYTDSDKGLLYGGNAEILNCFHTNSDSSFGTCVNKSDISSGYVAYMLRISAESSNYANSWGQNLSLESSYPILDTNYEVFCAADKYDNKQPSDHDSVNIVCNNDGSHKYYCEHCKQNVEEECRYVDGFCSICGYFDENSDHIIYNEAGDYTLPVPKDSSVIGWITPDGEIYQCGSQITAKAGLKLSRVTLNLNTVGASVRLNSGSTGIKFATDFELNGADYEQLQIKAGTLICPTDYVTNDSVLDYQNFIDNDYLVIIQDIDDVSFNEITVNGNTYDNAYFGSIININAFNYGRAFTGCGFVEITYADGTSAYFYASAKASQSVYSLAAKAFADRKTESDEVYANQVDETYFSRYTNDELEVLSAFIDGVVCFDMNLGTKSEPTLSVASEIESFYTPAYTVSADYDANTITITGNENWRYYIPVTKSDGETIYQRVCIIINGKRVSYSNNDDNFEIPESTVANDSDEIFENVMTIKIVGIE